jgi:hypothetical protein
VFSLGSAQPRRLPYDRTAMHREAPDARRRPRPESCNPGPIKIPTQ